jgi:threonine dehydrogenase-like Zn-dependent dehydrogenase
MKEASQRAALLVGARTTQVARIEIPEVPAGHVRIRLQGCGICASNLSVWEGRSWFNYPQQAGSPGHEGWGLVDAVGEGVDDLDIGDRVAVISHHAYSEYDIAPRECVVRLPSELDDEPFPGEPLGCAMNIFERSQIRRGDRVGIVGAGFLGLLLTQLAVNAGAHVVVLSRREFALQLAATMGAEYTASTEHSDARDRALAFTDQRGCNVVIEAVGLQSSLDLASALTGERGRLVIAGYHQDGLRQINLQEWNWRGIDVINAHERAMERYVHGIRNAVDAVIEGRLDPFPLLTHRVDIGSLDRGFELTSQRPQGFVKAMMINEALA